MPMDVHERELPCGAVDTTGQAKPQRIVAGVAWVVSSRVSLVILGIACGWLAWTTHYGYTADDLPGRDLLVVMLVAMFVCGIAAAALRPTKATRSAIGVGLMIHSGVRAVLLYLAFPHIGINSGLPLHFILFYVGLLITFRSFDGGDGAT